MKLFFATPIYNYQCAVNYLFSMIKAVQYCEKNNIPYEYYWQINSFLQEARNLCVDEFLKSDCTHLVFIDYDVSFQITDVIDIIYKDKEFVGGLYPKRCINWTKIINAAQQGFAEDDIKKYAYDFCFEPLIADETIKNQNKELMEVSKAGSGYLVLQRCVFEKLKPHVKCIRMLSGENVLEPKFNFFESRMNPQNGALLHDDWSFCELWKQQGGKVYIAPWALGSHIGPQIFGHSEFIQGN